MCPIGSINALTTFWLALRCKGVITPAKQKRESISEEPRAQMQRGRSSESDRFFFFPGPSPRQRSSLTGGGGAAAPCAAIHIPHISITSHPLRPLGFFLGPLEVPLLHVFHICNHCDYPYIVYTRRLKTDYQRFCCPGITSRTQSKGLDWSAFLFSTTSSRLRS